MPKKDRTNSTQPAQPAQATQSMHNVQLNTVNNLGYPDDGYPNVCGTRDLIEAYFEDYGLTEKLDLKKIKKNLDMVDQHEKKLEDHENEINSLKKRVETLEKSSQTQPATATQQTQQAQATQQPAQPVQTQQAQLTPFGNGVTIEQLYRSGDIVAFDKDDAIQTAGGNGPEPVKVRCFVNGLKQAAQLTPEQMVVCGFGHIMTKVK